MKKASDVAEITKEAIKMRARAYLLNDWAGLIIKAAEAGKDHVTLRLPSDFNREECDAIGPEIVRILQDEFDYIAKYSCYADYRETSATITVKWGHAIWDVLRMIVNII